MSFGKREAVQMTEVEAELWRVLDEAVFGTREPEKIRQIAKEAAGRWVQLRSTLGGYLCSVRGLRELDPADCARLTGVREKRWLAWEANQRVPSTEELETIIESLELGRKKREALYRLRGEALKKVSPSTFTFSQSEINTSAREWKRSGRDLAGMMKTEII